MAGRLAVTGDGAVLHRQLRARIAESRGGVVEKQLADLGAGEAQRDPAELDRLAARRIALVGRQIGVAGAQHDPIERDVEFLGSDLPHRGQDALADLDPAGRDRHLAGHVEPDPAVEPRVGREQRRQGGGSGGAHGAAPAARIRSAATRDSAQDAGMAAAAANIVVERLGDLTPRRREVVIEQRLRRDQDAGQTIAALARLLVEKGLLQGMRAVGRTQPFDRQDVPAGNRRQCLAAGFDRLAVDQHHAAAALFEAAAEFRAEEAEMIAQNIEERRVGVGSDADLASIHIQTDCLHRCLASRRRSRTIAKAALRDAVVKGRRRA